MLSCVILDFEEWKFVVLGIWDDVVLIMKYVNVEWCLVILYVMCFFWVFLVDIWNIKWKKCKFYVVWLLRVVVWFKW